MAMTEITPQMEDLVDLVKRLAKACAPDPDLDAAIWGTVSAAFGGQADMSAEAAPVTGSLDAALALLSRIRPGWTWKLQRSLKGGEFFKFTLDPPDGVPVRGFNESLPALSVVDALLRSLIEHGSD